MRKAIVHLAGNGLKPHEDFARVSGRLLQLCRATVNTAGATERILLVLAAFPEDLPVAAESDGPVTPNVAAVSEGLARRHWPGVDPGRVLGECVRVEGPAEPSTVVGVVGGGMRPVGCARPLCLCASVVDILGNVAERCC
ncbi:MAG TPA: hypothetical protein VKA84_15890 [Gemmatimonadaceae bacterium]|nr:hypothetical protein [Gemmatimonadaceae bacterium]